MFSVTLRSNLLSIHKYSFHLKSNCNNYLLSITEDEASHLSTDPSEVCKKNTDDSFAIWIEKRATVDHDKYICSTVILGGPFSLLVRSEQD